MPPWPTYRYLGGLVVGFLALVQAFLLLQALHRLTWNGSRLLGALLGFLLVLLANVLPCVTPNWWIGIRTPWTLSREAVWRRTHRLGGQTGVLAGLTMIAANLFLPTAWVGIATVVILLLWGVGVSAASYWFFTHPSAH